MSCILSFHCIPALRFVFQVWFWNERRDWKCGHKCLIFLGNEEQNFSDLPSILSLLLHCLLYLSLTSFFPSLLAKTVIFSLMNKISFNLLLVTNHSCCWCFLCFVSFSPVCHFSHTNILQTGFFTFSLMEHKPRIVALKFFYAVPSLIFVKLKPWKHT